MSSKFTTTIQQYADTEDYFIEIPEELCQELGWKEGDTIDWKIDGESIIISKVNNSEELKEEHRETDFDQVYDNYIEETAKETFGQYYHSPEAQGGWYAIKAEAIRQYS